MSEVGHIPGDEVRVVLSTISDTSAASHIAHQLLEERLIACANIVPGVTSVYRWKGEVKTDAEVLMILKTRTAMLEQLEQRIQELHPYEVPEIISLPSGWTSEPYARWVLAESRGTSS